MLFSYKNLSLNNNYYGVIKSSTSYCYDNTYGCAICNGNDFKQALFIL